MTRREATRDAMRRKAACQLGCQLGHCLVPTLQAFADVFRFNKTATTVHLRNNKFGDEGLKARPPQRPRLSRRKRDLAHLCAIVETCDRTIRASCEGLGFHDISALCRSSCSFYFHAAWICFVSWGSEQFFVAFLGSVRLEHFDPFLWCELAGLLN